MIPWLPRGPRAIDGLSGAMLGLVCFPILLAVAEDLRAGTARAFCFAAAGAAAIGAVALLAKSLDVHLGPSAQGGSEEKRDDGGGA